MNLLVSRFIVIAAVSVWGAGGSLGCSRSGGGSPLSGAGGDSGGSGGNGGPVARLAVVTDRYDNARSAWNPHETILNSGNVTQPGFGLLFSRAITGNAYGQPLYVAAVDFGGGVEHNVVYVATAHNWIYAFDADDPAAADPLWSRMLGDPLVLGTAGYDPGCTDMRNEVGITSTPVISLADNQIFVVAKVPGDQHLHALDLATGADAAGSPVSIGNMAMTAFDPMIHLNRTSLLLQGGVVYIAYGSHCDEGAYHGWLFGYDAKTLQLVRTYNTTPTGTWGAIWQSGVGLSSDGSDIFATVGNGTSSLQTDDGLDMGNNVVRLTPTGGALTVAAHYQAPIHGDNDLQSGAALLGSTGQLLGGGKDGMVLLLRSSDMSLLQQTDVHSEINGFAYWDGSAGPTRVRLAHQPAAARLSGRARQPDRDRDQQRAAAEPSVGDVHHLVERRDAGHGRAVGVDADRR